MTRTAAVLLALTGLLTSAEAKDMFVYFGTYTGGNTGSKGIYVFRFDPATGALTDTGQSTLTPSPSYLALAPSGRFLYAANEDWSKPKGSLTAFAINPATGGLTELGGTSSLGGGPCFLTVDATAKAVLATNYGSGSLVVAPLEADGRVGASTDFVQFHGSSVNKQRQKEPHAHSVNLSPDNRFVFACDLGTDKIMVYRLDAANAKLTPADPPFASVAPGSGPRHFCFAPSGKFAWLINEMSNTLTGFSYDAETGRLTELQTVPTLPAGWTGHSTTAHVAVTPDGRFLYGSNRGHDSLVCYSVDAASGRLTYVGHQLSGGKTPRNFAIDPTGGWLLAAHQDSGNVVVFKLDRTTGKLTPTGTEVKVPKAVCVKFLPAP